MVNKIIGNKKILDLKRDKVSIIREIDEKSILSKLKEESLLEEVNDDEILGKISYVQELLNRDNPFSLSAISDEFPNDDLLRKIIDALSDEEIIIKLRGLLREGNLNTEDSCPEFGDCSDDCSYDGVEDCPTDNTGCSTLA